VRQGLPPPTRVVKWTIHPAQKPRVCRPLPSISMSSSFLFFLLRNNFNTLKLLLSPFSLTLTYTYWGKICQDRVNAGKWGCYSPFHEECPKHHGHKGDPGVTPGTCGPNGERAQVMLVWVRAPGVGNASHPRTLGVIKVRPWPMSSLWRSNFRILKNSPIRGVN
jgi:hypothetical protein